MVKQFGPSLMAHLKPLCALRNAAQKKLESTSSSQVGEREPHRGVRWNQRRRGLFGAAH
jgi:hypothetical protein